MKTTNIYFPKFPWFYESILSSVVDSAEDYEIENFIEDWQLGKWAWYDELTNIIEIDYKATHEQMAKDWYKLAKSKLPNIKEDTGIELLDYAKMVSPNYYNYSTDEIDIIVQYDTGKTIAYLENNIEEFAKYIKEENTSYDGFMAFFPNEYTDYVANGDFEPWELTQIIDFYIDQWEKWKYSLDENFNDSIIMELQCELIYTLLNK